MENKLWNIGCDIAQEQAIFARTSIDNLYHPEIQDIENELVQVRKSMVRLRRKLKERKS